MTGINNTDALLNSFLKTAQNILTYFDDDKDNRTKLLNDLEKIVRNNCTHDEKTKKVTSTVRNIIGQGDVETSEAMKLFKEQKNELIEYQPDISQNASLKEYLRQVKELSDAADGTKRPTLDDEDIEMTQNDINVIDPFTKKRMTDPVKNKRYPVIWLCGETKSMISNILILNSENNTENDHLADTRSYTHHKNIFLADRKEYNFLFNKTQDRIRTDESNHQAQSITFKGRRLLSHVYYDAENEESKSATQSHTKTGNHDEKSKNNELETEDDYGDDLYDDDDDAEEEEENQEDVLYEEEPVTDRPDEDEDDDEDDPEEDIDLSSAESSAPLLALVCSLALLTLLDFIY
ncbi:hypothetical protein TSAR_013480 [Trichomalopsis sarcophagae]|uniref:Uncharacterized protein n=1 Tax=Trichomalopsis sarcophagae TaxID=543379 RepID=A0A232EGD0_9HYME|nr:hypothetical protein TSAR_013480 [Trichomalopsis sarcophagae]